MKYDTYHPLLPLLYLAGAFTGTILFRHPVCLVISLVSAWLCASRSAEESAPPVTPWRFSWYASRSAGGDNARRLRREHENCFQKSEKVHDRNDDRTKLVALLIGILWALWYSTYHHQGVTILGRTPIGNAITLESLVYGCMTGMTLTAILLWLMVFHRLMTTDKIVYLLGRISPGMSLWLSRFFRVLPVGGRQISKMQTARRGIGRDSSALSRVRSRLSELSMAVGWTAESLTDSSDSMKSRGGTMKGRTAYAIYRLQGRERVLLLLMSALAIVIGVGFSLDQMTMQFLTRIIGNRITFRTVLIYVAYGGFLLLPILDDIIS